MKYDQFRRSRKGGVIILPFILYALLLTACGPTQQQIKMAQDRLESARKAYQQARADRQVEAYAPVPLADAGKALQAAEQASNYKDMDQLSYLAERKTRIAVTIAEGRMAERETERLSKETAEILLQKREQEARVAKKEAEQARRLAQAEEEKAARARMEARAKAREAEESARQAEARRWEAEQARQLALAESEKASKAALEAEKRRRQAEESTRLAEARRREAEQLIKEVSELKGKLTDQGIVLTMGDVLFATDKSSLSPEANRSVEKLAEFLQKYQNRGVLIEGHTDSVGSDEYNLGLSQRRAKAVADELIAKGIDPGRIATKGYGKKYPVDTNDTPAGRQQNRRVEVIILNEGVKPETQFR